MLAKIWRKLLFIILIIACLFNVMNKIVHRESLELNLINATQGSSIFSIIKEKAVELKENVTTTINNVVTDDTGEEVEEEQTEPGTIDGIRNVESNSNDDIIIKENGDNSTVVIF